MRLSSALYLPQAKWKSGERRALRTATARGDRLVPAFKVTPAGSFDPEEQRVLSPTEYLKRFGQQLAECRGRQLAFIDAELIDDDRHRKAVGAHPLTELLERARISGANAAPIFSRSNTADYLAAVARWIVRGDSPVACFRVGLQELEHFSSSDDMPEFVKALSGKPEQTVLLIDGGPLQIDDPEDLAHLLSGQMARLIREGEWLRVFWSATSFPDRPKLGAGSTGRFPRSDWQAYQAIHRNYRDFPVIPLFSDYMLEFPSDYAPLRVSPTAQLRYSTENDYIYCKGKSTKVGDKYRNIFSVAAQLASTGELREPEFSVGDAYIHRLSTGSGKTGNASMWRWCATDHHLALVDEQLTRMFGIARERPIVTNPAEQLLLV